jgi:tripeptidyl-peptidase-1
MHFSRWLSLSLVGMVTASPRSMHDVHEKRNVDPIAWTKQSRALEHEVLPVRIGLTQRNLEHSDRFLEDIADPDSPNFGRQQIICY